MKRIHIEEPGAIETVIEWVRHEAVMLQLPSVYSLAAAPTARGVEQLNLLKNRLSGKNYGTVMGRVDRFLGQAQTDAMPKYFREFDRLEELDGAFVRTAFASNDFNSAVIRNGTHQSLILDGIHRKLFVQAEENLSDMMDLDLWGGCEMTSLICTSANLSGDPLGSITDRKRAEAFALERGIGLFVTCEQDTNSAGSYPIFEFSGNEVSVQRDGPGLDRLMTRIPASIQRVSAA